MVSSFTPHHRAPQKVRQRGTPRAGEHRDHPIIWSNGTGACRFLHLHISFHHNKFHYFAFSQGLQDIFFPSGL